MPLRRSGPSGVEESPKSTSLIRPPAPRIRLPGLRSPWITGGDLGVQVGERLGGLRQVAEHARGGKPGPAALGQQGRQVGALDPVHRHDVVVAVEEVLAHERERGMRREREQHAGLGEQRLARRVVADPADLQRDQPVVAAVERLDDGRLAAGADRAEDLVAFPLNEASACAAPAGPAVDFARVAPQIELVSGVRSRSSGPARGAHDDRQGRRERHRRRRRRDGQRSPRRARALRRGLVRDRPRLLQRDLGQRRADLVLAAAAPRRRDPGRADPAGLPRPARRGGRRHRGRPSRRRP